MVIRVTDQTGAVVPGAKIRVVPGPDPAPKMETDGKGQLALNLNSGGYALFVRSQGFKPVVMHFDVQLQKAAQTVQAVVHVASDGVPLLVRPGSSKDDLAIYAYPYHEPAAFSVAEIHAMTHIAVTVHNSHTNADETYSGVCLADILTRLGAPLGKELRGESLANYIVAGGSDGYQVVLAIAEVDPVFHPGEVRVADSMNGKSLDEHNGPLKLVVTEDKRPARSVRNLSTIEIKEIQ